jgi:hypothetical protein
MTTKHSPETWKVSENYVKGDHRDMYPLLFERVHATEADMRLAAAAPALLDALRLALTDLEALAGGHGMPVSDPDHPLHASVIHARCVLDSLS